MEIKELHIKNMVCNRCIRVVTEEIEKLGFKINSIELGRVELSAYITAHDHESIKEALEHSGFEILNNSTAKIISNIKTEIIKVIHNYDRHTEKVKFSEFLSDKLGKDYSYLSNLFSLTEGVTIEKFIILQKIEKVKELLIYNELSLTEIAAQLNYSSTQYLSKQFNDITGFTPTIFKKNFKNKRIPIDEILKSKQEVK